jgi:hypothetical protein
MLVIDMALFWPFLPGLASKKRWLIAPGRWDIPER